MNIIRNLESFLVGQISFPASNALFNRRGIMRQYRGLKRTQFASTDELRALQFRKTKSILEYANQFVLFYKERFAKIDFHPEDFKELEDLRHIPTLKRSELIEFRQQLVDTRWHEAMRKADISKRKPGEPLPFALFRGKQLIQNRSSGSTGSPTIFYENGSISAASWATELRVKSWFGIAPGSREARMVRITIDQAKKKKRASFALRRLLWNQLTLPGASLTEEDLAFAAKALKKGKPNVLWGATATLKCLAEFLKESPNLSQYPSPELIITWAAPMYEHERVALEEGFQCPATNIYGGCEVGHIGAKCEQGTMHLNQETVLLEEEFPQREQPSELIATSLVPSPMPFIRYRMGDLGKLGNSSCSCGKNLQILEEFTGRTNEIYSSKSGFRISPGFWCYTFTNKLLGATVKRFQIVYRPNDHILVRIVRGTAYSQETENELKTSIVSRTFPSAKIEFEYPDDIGPALSGKYQMVVNQSGN